MKRVKLLVLSLVAVLVLSGCGQAKTLKCEGQEDGMKTTFTSEFDKKGKFATAEMVMYFDVTDDMLKVMSLNDLKDSFVKTFEQQMKGIDVKVEDNGKDQIIITMNMDEKSVKEFSGESRTESYSELKKSLEEQNFTCK